MYNDNSKVRNVDIDKEMRKSFLEYSMSVIVARALPDVRDGMKPVHRRIIYTMNESGNTYDKAYRKCAYTVGEVLVNIILTATRPFTTPSFVLRRNSPFVIRL